MSSGRGRALSGVFGGGGSDVFAVGWDGTILHYAGEHHMIRLPLVLRSWAP